MERTLTLPLELHWKEANIQYNNPRRTVLGTIRMGAESALTTEIGELLDCRLGDRDGREVAVIRYKPNIDSAKRVWNTPRLLLIIRLTHDRIATGVDAELRSVGVGGVIGVEPPWARFVGAGGDATQDDTSEQERCAYCDWPMCFESDGKQVEYEVCTSCSKHICPSCATFEGEDPLCPRCAATPADPEWLGEGILRELSEKDRAEIENLASAFGALKLECAPHSTWVAIAQMCLGKAEIVANGSYDMTGGDEQERETWSRELRRIGNTILREILGGEHA